MLASALSVLAMAAAVKAHGHVASIIVDGTTYSGGIPYNAPADAIGWTASNGDNGFVEPNSFGTSDVACHKSSVPATNAATVAAGSTITLQWNTWPDSHHGPIIDYLAPVSDFASANPATLQFAKVAAAGLNSGSNPGDWATDDLIANGFAWDFTVPSNLAPGSYVLRHEIIALHSAGNANGAQSYPQCINLEVTGSGSAVPSGVAATSLYTAQDPGILFSLYEEFSEYPMPGPALWSA